MNVRLHIIDVRAKGVQVATPASTGDLFWLPRQHVTWSEPPRPGGKVTATLPRWLAVKNRQLVAVRGQLSIAFHKPIEFDPIKAERPIPMTDFPADAGKGALFRNTKAEKPSHPSHTGTCEIDGKRYRIAAWVKTSEKTGEKYFSLSFRPDAQQQPAQQKPASGPRFDDETIPFEMEWR